MSRAIDEHIPKQVIKRNDGLEVPTKTSLTDIAVLNEFMLSAETMQAVGKMRVQWQHYHIERQDTNEIGLSCSAL